MAGRGARVGALRAGERQGKERDAGQGLAENHRGRVFFFVSSHLPKFALNAPTRASEREGACARGGGCRAPLPRRSRRPRARRFFDDFRAAANAVCFALRSANPRAPWQAAALAALFALASRWRLKHINKAEASGEASVLSSLPLLE